MTRQPAKTPVTLPAARRGITLKEWIRLAVKRELES